MHFEIDEEMNMLISRAQEGTGVVMLFYNPGNEVSESFAYDHPGRIGREAQPAYMHIKMPKKGFVEVPSTLLVSIPEAGIETQVPLPGMYNRFMSQFRERGVVMVEKPRHKTRVDDAQVVDNWKQAVKLGDKLYQDFLKDKVNEWFQKVDQIKADGGVPRGATGLYALALKELSIADPADRMDTIQHVRDSAASNSELEKKLEDTNRRFEQLIAALAAGKSGQEALAGVK